MSNTIYCGHSDNVFALSWNPDGVSLASGSRDTTVRVWNAATGEDSYIYRGHHSCVLSVAWNPVWGAGNDRWQVYCIRRYRRYRACLECKHTLRRKPIGFD